jgi:hypothetical protein
MINVHGNGEYKGCTVETWDDVEPEENIKTETCVKTPDGNTHYLDISPYVCGAERVKLIEAVIDAGFPDRGQVGTFGAFHPEDLDMIKAYGKRIGDGLCEDCKTAEGRYSMILVQRICRDCFRKRSVRVFGS